MREIKWIQHVLLSSGMSYHLVLLYSHLRRLQNTSRPRVAAQPWQWLTRGFCSPNPAAPFPSSLHCTGAAPCREPRESGKTNHQRYFPLAQVRRGMGGGVKALVWYRDRLTVQYRAESNTIFNGKCGLGLDGSSTLDFMQQHFSKFHLSSGVRCRQLQCILFPRQPSASAQDPRFPLPGVTFISTAGHWDILLLHSACSCIQEAVAHTTLQSWMPLEKQRGGNTSPQFVPIESHPWDIHNKES